MTIMLLFVTWHATVAYMPRKPQRFPVTDPKLDAPDGAEVDGYRRSGDSWEKVPSSPGQATTSAALAVRSPEGALAHPLPFEAPSQRRVFESFLEGRSPATRKAYRADLGDFAAFTGDVDPEMAIARLLASDQGAANGKVLEYRNHLLAKKLSPATINRRLATLRSMVKLARMLGRVSWEIDVEGLDAMAYRDTEGPGVETLEKLFALIEERQDAKGRRDLAILRLLFDLGLRRGEVVELDVIHLSERGVSVLGKGRRVRELLILPDVTRTALNAWLDVHPGGSPLFVSLDPGAHERLTAHGLFAILAAWSASLDKSVRPHGIRHTAITSFLVASNGNIGAAQSFARHRNANTTMRYNDNRVNARGEAAVTVSGLIPSKAARLANAAGEIRDPEALLALIPEEPKRPRPRRGAS